MPSARMPSAEAALPKTWFHADASPTEQARVRSGEARRRGEPTLDAGSVLSRFIVLRQLGSGATARVYLAYDTRLSRKVALKLLKSSRDPQAQSVRLMAEAQAMARVLHPGVVTVYDAGMSDGRAYLALEYVDGVTLSAWAAGKDWRAVLSRYLAAGAALGAAHAQGVVHRDFKPDNVLVGWDGQVKISDFGLAHSDREVNREKTIPGLPTNPGGGGSTALEGTPRYMSPEQLNCDPVTSASDQFSFCVALYEALYGELPFEGATLRKRAANVLDGRLRAPKGGSEVPSRVWEVLRRGLARDPGARFGTMEELIAALTESIRAPRTAEVAFKAVAIAAGVASAFFVGALLF